MPGTIAWRRFTIVAALATLLLMSAQVGSAAASGTWTTAQLTNNEADDAYPTVSDSLVAWTGFDGTDYEIFIWKPGDATPTQLTSNDAEDWLDDVSGDRVVWMSSNNPWDENAVWDEYTWKVGDEAPTRLTWSVGSSASGRVDGDRVVWITGHTPTAPDTWSIWTWKAGESGPTHIADNGFGANVSGDRVVWFTDTGTNDTQYDLYTWKAGDQSPTPLAATTTDESMFDIADGRVAWISNDYSTGTELFTWAEGDSDPTLVDTVGWDVQEVRVSGDRLAWTGRRLIDEWFYAAEIFTWKVGDVAPTQLTDDRRYNFLPEIDGDQIVWQSAADVETPDAYLRECDVYTWKVGEAAPTCLYDDAPHDDWMMVDPRPQVAGDRVVWHGWDGTDNEIYMATLESPYVSSGVLQPLNPDGTSIFKAGSTIPVKLQLSDRSGNPVSGATVKVYISQISDGVSGAELEASSSAAADTGNIMRNPEPGLYIFNLSTKGFSVGTYRLRIVYPDGTSSSVDFSVK